MRERQRQGHRSWNTMRVCVCVISKVIDGLFSGKKTHKIKPHQPHHATARALSQALRRGGACTSLSRPIIRKDTGDRDPLVHAPQAHPLPFPNMEMRRAFIH